MKGIPNTKYISFNKSNNSFVILKRINGKVIHFGYYLTLEEAIKYRDYFIKNEWDMNKRLLFSKKRPTGYIDNLPNGKYIIRKTINGERLSWGIFNTFEEAENERELLRQCNWDYDAICESIDETENGIIPISNIRFGSTFQKRKQRNDVFLAKTTGLI